jgi:hypothetical protein
MPSFIDDQDKLSQIERHLQKISDRLFTIHMILAVMGLLILLSAFSH